MDIGSFVNLNAEMTIYDNYGTVVYQTCVLTDIKTYFNMPELKSGIYLVRIQTGNQSITRKLIITK